MHTCMDILISGYTNRRYIVIKHVALGCAATRNLVGYFFNILYH